MPDPPRRPPVAPGTGGLPLPPPGRRPPLEPPLHPRRTGDTHVGLAPLAPGAAPAPPPDLEGTLSSAEPPRHNARPEATATAIVPEVVRIEGRSGGQLARRDSPPPVSVPTSAAEREAARLRAELQDARAELAARARPPASEPPPAPPSRRSAGQVARDYAGPGGIATALIAAAAALLKPAPAPESVDAQGARLAVLEQQAAQARARELDWREYDRRRREAGRCRDVELGSALARLGYRTSLPRDAETFLSERLDDVDAVRPSAPAWRPREPCAPLPDPPP